MMSLASRTTGQEDSPRKALAPLTLWCRGLDAAGSLLTRFSALRFSALRFSALRFSALLIPLAAVAQSPNITCGSGTNAVQEGQSITCTASASISSWSLTGVGSLSNQTSTSVTYTAPASIPVNHQMGGCMVLPNDSIYNTRIDNLPVNPLSSVWMANIGGAGFGMAQAWGVTLVDSNTPTATIKNFYGDQVLNNFPRPLYPNLHREGGDHHSHWDGGDHHEMMVRKDTCQFSDVYNDYRNEDAPTNGCNDGTAGCNAQGAISYPWSTYGLTSGTDAAGLPLAPLTLHLDEIKNGAINHPMRFTSCIGCIYSGVALWPAVGQNGCPEYPGSYNVNGKTTLNGAISAGATSITLAGNIGLVVGAYIWIETNDEVRITGGASPNWTITATAHSHANGVTVSCSCVNSPPMGARFRLKSSFNISGYSAMAQEILTAWKQYGLILADIGAEQAIIISGEINEDQAASTAVGSIGIGLSNFEAVDESSLQFAAGSLETCPLNQTCLGAQNTYETPNSQAILVANPVSGSAVSTPIAIQGVTIGLSRVDLFMPAGAYTYQIPYWVNGTSNQAVTWTLTSGVGSVTSGGIYTPPPDTSGGTTATLKVTSNADTNAVNYEYITIIPAGLNPTGSIRIDTGNGSGSTDGNGNVWQPGYIGKNIPNGFGGSDPRAWQNQSNPEIEVYQTFLHTYGDDLAYDLVLPNGNYKVRFLLGMPFNFFSNNISTFGINYYGNMELQAQGQIGAHNFALGANQGAGYYQLTGFPSDAYIPAKVTNNELHVSEIAPFYQVQIDQWGLCGDCFSDVLSGLEVIPDTTPAHWTIDTQQQTTISSGAALVSYPTSGSQSEYGTAFYTGSPLYVTGVRFYKGANDTGTHTGSLWNVQSSGQTFAERSQVATATFSGETSAGWQQVNFATPQLLIANQLYIVSYNSPTGNTAIEANGYYSASTAQWAFQNGTVVASSGAGTTGTGFPTGKGANLRLVDPVLSVNASGANPFTLFGNSGPPGQQLRLYVVDWYTGLSDAQWSILSGPGTIENGVDQFGVPCALYTAPSTQPTAGTAVVIQAQSASNPSITATTRLSFTGSEWSVK